MSRLLIGVDGGGTKTIAVAAREDGTIIAVSSGSGINYNNIGMARSRNRLRGIVDRLLAQTGGGTADLCIGMPALSMQADEALVRAYAGDRFDDVAIDMQSDAYVALMGHTLGKPGLIVICGTGSMLAMLDRQGRQRVMGGWGHLLGDPGSGYSIGLDGMRAAIAAYEAAAAPTGLTDAMRAYFEVDDLRDVLDIVYDSRDTVARIAGFARTVLRMAESGDTAARDAVRANMRRIAHDAGVMLAGGEGMGAVGLYGGIFLNSALAREIFLAALREKVPGAAAAFPRYPPEIGALIHLFGRRGAITPQLLRNLEGSYSALSARKKGE